MTSWVVSQSCSFPAGLSVPSFWEASLSRPQPQDTAQWLLPPVTTDQTAGRMDVAGSDCPRSLPRPPGSKLPGSPHPLSPGPGVKDVGGRPRPTAAQSRVIPSNRWARPEKHQPPGGGLCAPRRGCSGDTAGRGGSGDVGAPTLPQLAGAGPRPPRPSWARFLLGKVGLPGSWSGALEPRGREGAEETPCPPWEGGIPTCTCPAPGDMLDPHALHTSLPPAWSWGPSAPGGRRQGLRDDSQQPGPGRLAQLRAGASWRGGSDRVCEEEGRLQRAEVGGLGGGRQPAATSRLVVFLHAGATVRTATPSS